MSDTEVTPQPAPTAPLPNGAAAPEAPQEKLSPKLAQIMRREADAVRRMREAKTMEQKLKAERDAISAERAQIDEFNSLWKSNPHKAIKDRGLDPIQIALMQDGQMTPEMQFTVLRQEIGALKEELGRRDQSAQEQSKAYEEQQVKDTISGFREEISNALEASKEKFPLVHTYNLVDKVYAIIDNHCKKTTNPETGVGEILEMDKALELAEAEAVAQWKKGQEVYSKAEALKAPPQAESRRFQAPKEQQWVEKPVKTLAGIQQSVPSQTTRYLSDEERMDRAREKLRAMRQR